MLNLVEDEEYDYSSLALPLDGVATEAWVQDHVEWLYGYRLERFQLDIVMALLGGGLMSILMPTDFGKSTCLKISTVLSLMIRPKMPNMIVKISRTAASDAMNSIVFTLLKASRNPHYSYVKPMVKWSRTTGMPLVGHSFMIQGGDWDRTDNPSVYAASIWEADLQGRRGRCHIDDIETEKEARYQAYRERLEARVDSILRTIEDTDLFLFAFFGTPQHGASIYFKIVDKLRALGNRFKVMKFPYKDPVTGKLLWARRANKVEIHRRAMTPWAFAVAYELEPTKTGRMNYEEIEISKDKDFPYCRTRASFEQWLRDTYDNAGEMLAKAYYYIGYDPSAEYEYALAVMCFIGSSAFMLDVVMEPGDVFDQIKGVVELDKRYPRSTIVIERNGQQKAFRDLIVKQLPDADVQMHQTSAIKDDEKIGIPAMLQIFRQGKFHLPWANDEAAALSEYVTQELRDFSPLSHPHLLPAFWFAWYWHDRNIVQPAMAKQASTPDPGYSVYPMQIERAKQSMNRPRINRLNKQKQPAVPFSAPQFS